MKSIWLASALGVGMVLNAQPSAAETPRSFLVCVGFDPVLEAATEHNVTIYRVTAEIDGKSYKLTETPSSLTLTGPLPTSDTQVYINRLTGEYAITPSSLRSGSRALEWSRDGEGCRKASPKF